MDQRGRLKKSCCSHPGREDGVWNWVVAVLRERSKESEKFQELESKGYHRSRSGIIRVVHEGLGVYETTRDQQAV